MGIGCERGLTEEYSRVQLGVDIYIASNRHRGSVTWWASAAREASLKKQAFVQPNRSKIHSAMRACEGGVERGNRGEGVTGGRGGGGEGG